MSVSYFIEGVVHMNVLKLDRCDPRDLEGAVASEKFDGVQARWNGREMITRTGQPINAPLWLLDSLPDCWLVGELWAGYGTFDAVSAAVRSRGGTHPGWGAVRYKVWQAPAVDLGPHTDRVRQIPIRGEPKSHLRALLASVVERGGEGLVVETHLGDRLKLKPIQTADGIVTDHLPGRGKYVGQTGALMLRLDDGQSMRLGSGLSDALRSSPPPIGTVVEFCYQGRTRRGLPRFARFRRVRVETEIPHDEPLSARPRLPWWLVLWRALCSA